LQSNYLFQSRPWRSLAIVFTALVVFVFAHSPAAQAQTTVDPVACTGYPETRIFLETHAWLTNTSTGTDPSQVRLGACFPYKQTLSGKVNLDIRVTLHDNPGIVKAVDGYIATAGGTALVFKVPTTFACTNPGTCEKWFKVVADTTLAPYDGRQEFRLRADVTMPTGQRLLTTSGWQAYLKNGKPALNYRSGDSSDGQGFVDATGYTLARLGTDVPVSPVSGIWNFSVTAKRGSSGAPVTSHSVQIDPDFNTGTNKMELKSGSGELSAYSLSVDTRALDDGPHKLAIKADAAVTGTTGTGVVVIPFTVKNGTTTSPLSITTTSLPNGSVGSAYNAALVASGGTSPYKWRLASGTLPAGIALSTSGTLSGTPTTAGTYALTVAATDSSTTPQTVSQGLMIQIASANAPVAVAAQNLSGTVGSPFTATLSAGGGIPPYQWSISSGSPAPGLSLNANGTLSGTPTTAGAFSFVATAVDSTGRSASGTISTSVTAVTAVTPPPVTTTGSCYGKPDIFITCAELASKPTSGAGWTFLKSKADASWTNITIGDQNSFTQTYVLAAALVYARTGNTAYRDKVIAAVKKVPGTEANAGQLLAVARTLYGYVVAAEIVSMPQSTVANNGETWLHFLQRIRTAVIPGNSSMTTLEGTSKTYANNWGAHALSSHLAVSYALNDTAGIQRDINIIKRDLGDTTSPAAPFSPDSSYRYNGNGATWDMSPTMQRGINPYSATDKRDGMIVEDGMRLTSGGSDSARCCTVQPAGRGYMAEHLDGLISSLQLLRAHGVDLRSFQNNALRRAFDFYKRNGGQEYSTEQVLPYVINYFYGTNYPKVTETTVERKVGYGGWLFTGPTP
jgi:hypothetical protein